MLLQISLIIACSVLYWVGGEKWAHTKFRDWGCPLCIVCLSSIVYGWAWNYIGMFGIAWLGLSLGDDVAGDKWYWSLHGFIVGLSMVFISIWWGIGLALAAAGITYLVSKFLNRWGVDVWLRGLLYGSMPLILLKILPN